MIVSLLRPISRALAALALGVLALSSTRAATTHLTTRMEQVVQKQVGADRFTGAVLVARNGEVIFDRAYGLANREWEIPNTPETHFRIGSVTKQFTAVATLLLAERGKLKLTDPVSAHWTGAPETWSKVTLHHLLTQTSGIPNVTRDPEFIRWKFLPTTVREMVGRFRDQPLEFAPGERHAYSNSNYLVLGLVIEEVSGRTFGEFLRENILDPLGLNRTGLDSNLELLPRRASGYWVRGERIGNAPYSDMSVPHAAGAMYSTTHDLWRWAEAVLGPGGGLLSAESRTKLLTPARDNYACGLRVADFQGRKVVEHGGNIAGFSSHLRHYPDQGLTLVVLSNLSTGRPVPEDILRELATLVLDGDGGRKPGAQPVRVSAAALEAYCGVYDVGRGTRVTFKLVNGDLAAQPEGAPEAKRVTPLSESTFLLSSGDTEIEFVREASGKVTHLVMRRDGRMRTAPRVSD